MVLYSCFLVLYFLVISLGHWKNVGIIVRGMEFFITHYCWLSHENSYSAGLRLHPQETGSTNSGSQLTWRYAGSISSGHSL